MRFVELSPDKAVGGLLAHRLRLPSGRSVDKGTEVTAALAEALTAEGVAVLAVVQLATSDVPEDAAARALLAVLNGSTLRGGIVTRGRANLYAATDGLFLCDEARVHALNAVNEAITLATLRAFEAVKAGQLLATVKIIPFAAPADALANAVTLAKLCGLEVAAYRGRAVQLIQSSNGLRKPAVLAKSDRVMRARLIERGVDADDITSHTVAHQKTALAQLLGESDADLTIILGETAIADRGDVIPAALMQAGGEVVHFGMPVDPGNLLLLGRLRGKPVIGAPGCARSPAENGLDFVLDRILADQPLDASDLTALGVGGLLKEDSDARLIARSADRPVEVREAQSLQFAALLLAGGFSRRMGDADKLGLAAPSGQTVLQESAAAFGAVKHRYLVQRAELPRALPTWQSVVIERPNPKLSDSLQAGLDALPPYIDAVIVGLGDMPAVTPQTVAALVAAFAPDAGAWAVRPRHQGRVGNPILIGRRLFAKLQQLSGDRGARALLDQQSHLVLDIDVDDPGVLLDIDTPQAYDAYLRYSERER